MHLRQADAGLHPSFSPSHPYQPTTLHRAFPVYPVCAGHRLPAAIAARIAARGSGGRWAGCASLWSSPEYCQYSPHHQSSLCTSAVGCEMSGRCEDRRSTDNVYFQLRVGIPFRRSPLPLPFACSFARAIPSTFCSALPAHHNNAPTYTIRMCLKPHGRADGMPLQSPLTSGDSRRPFPMYPY
jgi:hypothetical protein